MEPPRRPSQPARHKPPVTTPPVTPRSPSARAPVSAVRIMGLRDGVLYSSWWLFAIAQFTLITLICTVLIKMFVVHTPSWVVALYIGSFCFGAVSFAFLLSVFFSNAVLAAVVGPVAFFGTLLPRYLFFGR